MVNTHPADDLALPDTKASAGIVLTWLVGWIDLCTQDKIPRFTRGD